MMKRITYCVLLMVLVGCQVVEPVVVPTLVAAAPTLVLPTETMESTVVPPTWTPPAGDPLATNDPFDPLVWTPQPTPTPWPTWTPRPLPTNTPRPTAVPIPIIVPTTIVPGLPTATLPPVVSGGANLLPNSSFEGGWYHIDNIPELQVPNEWYLDWDEGANPLDPAPWNRFVRPESRVLPSDFLPPAEHSLFIWDGEYTVKIFKGTGALSFRLLTDVYLEAGTYEMEVNIFPDLVMSYTVSGAKIWADDPLAGEVRFMVNEGGSDWRRPTFGQKNTMRYVFEVPVGEWKRVGVAIRGRWAIANNGWFMDNWSLRKLGG